MTSSCHKHHVFKSALVNDCENMRVSVLFRGNFLPFFVRLRIKSHQRMDSDSDTEFSYPDLQQPVRIQPYIFELLPLSQVSDAGGPSSSASQVGEEEEDDNINSNRIGHTEW